MNIIPKTRFPKSSAPIAVTFFLFFFVLSSNLTGQINAPDFLCVTNDTLTWSPASNSCGTFNAYEIYGSTNEQGPYSLLFSETDATQTNFFHADVNNQTWYYYLATNANCPGETTLFSDTLDNLIPLADDIQAVTIATNGVEVSWYPSPSPEVYAYVVSRNTNLGTTILDTIFGGLTTYLDTSADPENMSEVYFVVSIDVCGNKSLVVNPHATILLEVSPPDACQSGVVLNWNPYINWQQDVDYYEVFMSVNGNTEIAVAQVPGNTTTYTFMDANDGENLCFRIEAVENNTQIRSRSSTACTDVNILQPIRDVELLGANVNPDGSVSIEWTWDETALIANANTSYHRLNDDVVVVDNISLATPLSQLNTQTITNIDAQSSAYIFNIDATDNCDNTVVSNESQSPFLMGTAQGESSNLLTWDAYNHSLATSISYELVNISGTDENVIFTGTTFDIKHTHELNLNGADAAEQCYYLRVLVEYTLSNGEVLNRSLRSNTVCLIPTPQVYVPNVFAPNSINDKFRPFLSFNAPAEYNMDIFDRWGAHVATNKDINTGWNGKRNGELMPQGVYLYIITIKPDGGETILLTGDVMLLH